MADTLREVAQEAVARVEGAPTPPPDKITGHGKQVAGVLRAEADKDVFTTLQIAAGEQVSPAILRANIDVSIGILKADGTIDRPTGTAYESRYKRASTAVARAEKYFDDQKDFTEFSTSKEGKAVIASTGKFLMTHPALSEYFTLVPAADRVTAANALAEKYLQDPYAREKIKEALLESAINKGDVADEFSEMQVKAQSLQDKSTKLAASIAATEAEIAILKKRRAEFDKNPDLSKPKTLGAEYKDIENARSKVAGHDAVIAAHRLSIATLATEVQKSEKQWNALKGDPDRMRVASEIDTKNQEITKLMGEIADEERKKAIEQMRIDAAKSDKDSLDDKLRAKQEQLQKSKDDKKAADDELAEITIKKTRLEAGKARSEELAVSELENIFKKGVEAELMERLDKAKAAADKALEESAAKAKDIDEKQYRELRAKRHKTDNGKVDGEAIKEDFSGMMRTSTEYYIVRNTDNSVHISAKKPDGTWEPIDGSPAVPATIPAGSTFYLTGPEFAMLRMMNKTQEFGTDFMFSKLKDPDWMKQESEDFAVQTLRDKMYASRGWLQRRRTGVKRLSATEITKIKNSSWGTSMLEQALEQNKEHVKQMDAVMKSDILQGPGSWKEKIGRMSNKQLALLILGLTAGGALLGPVAWPALTTAGTAIGGIKLTTAAGGLVGAGAGAGAAGAGRSRTS